MFVLLLLCLFMAAALVLILVYNANNQEFKERTLILIDETNDGTTINKVQYTFFQLTKKKIEIEICPFENEVKYECFYDYPGVGYNMYKDGEYINLLDALEIQPGDTTTINMEDLEDEILDKFGYLLGERKGDGEGDASLPIIYYP